MGFLALWALWLYGRFGCVGFSLHGQFCRVASQHPYGLFAVWALWLCGQNTSAGKSPMQPYLPCGFTLLK